MNKNPSDVYWAAEPDSSTCATSIIEHIADYRKTLTETGVARRIIRSFNASQGYGPNGDAESSATTFAGGSGQLLKLTMNQYHTLATQTVTLITSNKPTVKALASNNDYASLAQCKFAEALNDYYDRELAISDKEREAARLMVLFGETWLVLDWDTTKGQPEMVDEENNRVLTQGDVRIYAMTPFDVARDAYADNVDNLNWMAFRRRISKWDLAAQFPDKRDEILSYSPSENLFHGTSDVDFDFFANRTARDSDSADLIFVWEFRHVPSPALPKGRLVRFIDAKTVLFDTVETQEAHIETVQTTTMVPGGFDPMTGQRLPDVAVPSLEEVHVDEQTVDHGYPYRDSLFAFSASPERVPGTTIGHTSFFDLLSLQENVDMLVSIMSSAVNAGGLQNLYVPRGSNVTATKLMGALNLIEYDGDKKPEAQANLSIPSIVPEYAKTMRDYMQSLVSMNEVVSGTPSAGMPAQGMALLRAQAIEFHSGLQEAYERLVQRGRTGILKLLQIFADSKRVALIAGKANNWAEREFKKQDLVNFNRFVIEPINPAMKTLAGKVSFAQPLLQGGMITPQQYLQLTSTGRLDPITDFSANNQARIERNKELLMDGVGLPPFKLGPDGNPQLNKGLPEFADVRGIFVRPLITDTFWADIPEYLAILATPEVRENNDVTQKVLQVVQYSMALWQQQPPAITAVLRGVAFPGGPTQVPPMGTIPKGMSDPQGTPPMKGSAPPADNNPPGQAQPPKLKTSTASDAGAQRAAKGDAVLSNAR